MTNTHTKLRITRLASLGLAVVLFAMPALSSESDEFVGPFPSWRDAQRDYGARGDGRADDTAALQRALDELIKHTNSCVLYLPAGTYRITQTLKTVRKAHTDCQGVAVVGEDPSRTVLRWDGTNGGTMFQWDAWYSKISRLTFDGQRSADTALVIRPGLLDLQRNQRPHFPRRHQRPRLRRPTDPRPGGERRAALPVPALRHGSPDGELELDGHLGLVLPLRGLRARRPQRHGQLARLGIAFPALAHRRPEQHESHGVLGGQQHQRRLAALL